MPREYVSQYEKLISNSETLLAVFEVMRDMFELLLENIEEQHSHRKVKSGFVSGR